MQFPQLMIIWGAIASSPIMLGLVGAFAFPPPEKAPAEFILLALGTAALMTGMAAFTVPVMLIKSLEPPVVLLMRWAMLEAIALYGLVARVLGAPNEVFGAFIGASLFLLILSRPRKELLEDLGRLKRGEFR